MKNRRDFLASSAGIAAVGGLLLQEAVAQTSPSGPGPGPGGPPPGDPNQLPPHTNFVLSPEADPYELLQKWLDDAKAAGSSDPTAVALSTVDAAEMPDVRMMHLNATREGRFLLQAEINTPKGEQLKAHPKAGLLFYWPANGRQVRIRGNAEQWSNAMADAEWAASPRPRFIKVKLSTWHQSQVYERTEDLEQRLRESNERMKGDIPRPSSWSGYSITPLSIEFWVPNSTLLHERLRFVRAGANQKWRTERLVP